MNTFITLAQASSDAAAAGAGIAVMVVYALFIVVMIASLWALFSKAGEPGWAAIVPIFNAVVMVKIAGKPIWWVLLLFIPLVNFIVSIILMIELAKAFGKGAGFGIGMVFLPFIFLPMLAFGSAQYQGQASF
jgi:hypothetical protein